MNPVDLQLHCFSNTASQGYAAVAYLRTECPNETVDVKFVTSKTRVAPTKQQSILRLELLGAVIFARFFHIVSSLLPTPMLYFCWGRLNGRVVLDPE